MLRRAPLIRPRPFYNTRHSYSSFLITIGAKPVFVSSQTGDSIRTLEKHCVKAIPEADGRREFVERTILNSETWVKPEEKEKLTANASAYPQRKMPMNNQGLKSGAGDGGRTHDLMLGKHTL